MRALIFIFGTLLTLSTSTATASPAIKAEFTNSFYTSYSAGDCGQNIANLIIRLRNQGVDLSRARVAIITNNGYFFSVTHRRNAGPKLKTPIGNIQSEAGIANFYHHIIFENDGEVYDYDFGNTPRVVSMKSYIKQMFWDEPAVTQYTGMERLSLRRDYRIAFVSALTYLQILNTGDAPKLDLSDFYDSLAGN